MGIGQYCSRKLLFGDEFDSAFERVTELGLSEGVDELVIVGGEDVFVKFEGRDYYLFAVEFHEKVTKIK